MTVDELRAILRQRPVPPDAYRLGNGGADETYILDKEGPEWVVYYSERGLRTEECRFEAEDAACAELLARLGRSFTSFDDDGA